MRSAALFGAALLLWPIATRASEPAPPTRTQALDPVAAWAPLELGEPSQRPNRRRRFTAPSWLSGPVRLKKGNGLEVTQQIQMGEQRLILGLQGPLTRKRLGVNLEVRF